MATSSLVVVLALALLAGGSCAPLLSTDIQTPITIPYDPALRPATEFRPLNDPTLPDANAPASQPTEVHLSPAGPNAMTVHWSTGAYKIGKGALTPNDVTGAKSIVKYGTAANALTQTASGTAEVYNQIYDDKVPAGATALNYTSPVLHNAVLANLQPATRYFYTVGDGNVTSQVFNFTSLQAPGQFYPQRFATIADWGMSQNASSTLDHIIATTANSSSPPMIFYIADFVYADTWHANGTVSNPNTGFEGLTSQTWQPVWDTWQRFIQPLVSHVPMLGSSGNHEIEQQRDAANTVFASLQARWKTPAAASKSDSYFFHSIEFGPVHSIFLSNYVDYSPGSNQWEWLYNDLMSVNRSVTPWVVVNFHNPWYTTDSSYKEFEQMRVSMEPITNAFGVDIFFYGHVHAYERSTPVNNYKVDLCGSVHITIGDAGNSEGLSFLNSNKSGLTFEDLAGGCPNVTARSRPSYLNSVNPVNDPFLFYDRTYVYQGDGNSTGVAKPAGYCYKSQPLWSAYREASFGHGVVDVLNATHALWTWHRNQDSTPIAADSIYIVRDPVKCPNKAGGAAAYAYTGPVTPSSPAAVKAPVTTASS
ncbi:hypothetical protein WJX72_009944 [[Myrmecia] bisecta]|uniref:Purple acid phosphatase n=1 Tax=[Myrmecia] bisecta TaxID=41462 RepID=A0AAW1QSY4_9CHLO